ncbi:MAG: acyltransferase [Leptolyngbya sp. SIOISBB]|nr:acyltransferase [Leptolyngbya sp. SIOISBB]
MQEFAHSLIAIPYFVSNLLYWSEAGYWDTASELKPLLHTWTLAIEAQFYMIFPLSLILIWKLYQRWSLHFIISIGVFSFIITQWGAYTFPTANFYLLPSRLWEFALGAVIGVLLLNQKSTEYSLFSYQSVNKILIRELSGIIGLSLIFLGFFKLHGSLPFPSIFALLPTVGTGLVLIFASAKTLVGRLLSNQVFVKLGLISYSAYLWHHPLFSFARHRSLSGPSTKLIWVLILLSFLLAYFTHKYVEKPFRSHLEISQKTFFLFWLIGSLIFIEIGIIGHLTAGFSDRTLNRYFGHGNLEPFIPAKVVTQIQHNSIDRLLHENAILQIRLDSADSQFSHRQIHPEGFGLGPICDGASTSAPECRTHENPDILLWGDSFAMQLAPGILASNPDAKLIQMTKSVCGPFFDLAPIVEPDYPVGWAQECLAFNQQVREWLQQHTVKYAVLASPFSPYLLSDNNVLIRDHEVTEANLELAVQKFEQTLLELRHLGIQPIVVSPPPTNDLDLGRCVARAEWLGLPQENCNFIEAEMSNKRVRAYQFIDAIQGQSRVLHLEEMMCANGICRAYSGDIPLYRDARHLSEAGAVLLGQEYDFYGIITNQ